MADLTITSLRGGMNNSDPPSSLTPDQAVLLQNVETFESMLGERRKGSAAIDLTSSSLTSHTAVTFLYRHTPSEDETAAELWALGVTFASNTSQLARKTTAWSTVAPVDAITVTGAYAFSVQAQSLHGKLFLAYKSAVDRLHVWDGTTLRRSGLAAPSAAPTGGNAGVGTFSGKRYYRTRETVMSGSTVTLRSEPSSVLTFTPSGTGASATVTKPATTNTNATHWEIEASLDNANFYRMAQIVIATTTHSDSVAFNTGYRATGTLSDDIEDYAVIPSVRYLATDGDRLLCGGSYEDASTASDIIWTPVINDPGDGNDERIPVDTDNRVSLDGREGGDLTGLSNPVYGYIYATKLSAIYRGVRSGLRARAYDFLAITKKSGALHGSLVEGVDAGGNACLYALDPKIGPIIISLKGVQRCGKDIQKTWKRLNIDATQAVCRAVYYPDKLQVHWWIAVDGANAPTLRIVLQTNESRNTDDGVRRGWSIHTIPTGTHVYAACLFADNIEDNAARSLALVPFIGTDDATGLIQQCDTGDDDNGTAYTAQITTRPIIAAGILNQFGAMSGGLLAEAAAGVTVRVSASRDFGVETLAPIDVPLDPEGSETDVIKAIDDFSFSELRSLQVVISDTDSPQGVWKINQFAIRPSQGQSA